MKHKLKRFLLVGLTTILLVMATIHSAYAITIEGSSSSTSTTAKYSGDNPSYATLSDDCVGYRFTIVNAAGGVEKSSIDVFLTTTYGQGAYNGYIGSAAQNVYELSTKYCKSVWKAKYESGSSYSVSTSTTKACDDSSCYYSGNYSFASAMPTAPSMKAWLEVTQNYTQIFALMGTTVSSIGSGNMLICEPLYLIKMEGTYYIMTVTEMGMVGAALLGGNSSSVSGNSSSFTFIANKSNLTYPNQLYTENGYGLWDSASELSSRTTYANLITCGYGVLIAYGNNTYTITFHSNSPNGTSRMITMTVTYGSTWSTESRTSLGFSQEDGYTWAMKWNTSADGTGDEYGSGTSQE